MDDHFKDAYDLYIKTGNVYLNSAHWSKGTTALRAETFTQLQQVALGSISLRRPRRTSIPSSRPSPDPSRTDIHRGRLARTLPSAPRLDLPISRFVESNQHVSINSVSGASTFR